MWNQARARVRVGDFIFQTQYEYYLAYRLSLLLLVCLFIAKLVRVYGRGSEAPTPRPRVAGLKPRWEELAHPTLPRPWQWRAVSVYLSSASPAHSSCALSPSHLLPTFPYLIPPPIDTRPIPLFPVYVFLPDFVRSLFFLFPPVISLRHLVFCCVLDFPHLGLNSCWKANFVFPGSALIDFLLFNLWTFWVSPLEEKRDSSSANVSSGRTLRWETENRL